MQHTVVRFSCFRLICFMKNPFIISILWGMLLRNHPACWKPSYLSAVCCFSSVLFVFFPSLHARKGAWAHVWGGTLRIVEKCRWLEEFRAHVRIHGPHLRYQRHGKRPPVLWHLPWPDPTHEPLTVQSFSRHSPFTHLLTGRAPWGWRVKPHSPSFPGWRNLGDISLPITSDYSVVPGDKQQEIQ